MAQEQTPDQYRAQRIENRRKQNNDTGNDQFTNRIIPP